MPRLFLIDSFGYIFRAYHARARSAAVPMRTTKGVPTEAVFIFHNMVQKLRADYSPEYLAAVYESLGPTFRDAEFAEYKANRTETPPDLLAQIPMVKRLLNALRIPVLEYDNFEADDVIGTLADRAAKAGLEVVIVSSDKDMLQLIGPGITMLNPAKDDAIYDREKVKEFMGVWPGQVADLLALKGDAVDNIPGAPGIGDKGAQGLLEEFGSLEVLLERAAEVKKKTYRESLLANREQIEMSKRLSTIATDVPIAVELDSLALAQPDRTELEAIYRELEFFTFLRNLEPEEAKDETPADYGALEDAEQFASFRGADPQHAAVLLGEHLGLSAVAGKARFIASELAREWLRGPGLLVTHDSKTLYAFEPETQGIMRDLMLEMFLLTADSGNSAFESMCEVYLRRKPRQSADERADLVLRLAERLEKELDANGAREIYETIELPLAPVLARMERSGIRVERSQLAKLSAHMEGELERLSRSIHEAAGREFNINSPQQLGKILFEEMGLPPPVKYGKGKVISTAADVLEGLAPEYPIAGQVLEYRGLAKLKGTYVDALPQLMRAGTGRVHTSFNQIGAATGRISSSNPNLQNIPIRTELGREIRAAFVPEPGWQMLVADYSQIELRLLAHMSRDPLLMESFRNGEDVHTRTAAEVFGASPLMVSPEMRRSAKAVNFGIVYGQTAFGLAAQLGIPKNEAEKYIRNYFMRYAGVKRFIEATIAEVRQTGYAETMFGRRRPIPDMMSKNPNARSFAERTAVNTPLQGTAADMIKLAMIRIDEAIRQRRMRARMILQVHDELVFEAPPEEMDELRAIVKSRMEGARQLDVPMVVDTGIGDNWRDAK